MGDGDIVTGSPRHRSETDTMTRPRRLASNTTPPRLLRRGAGARRPGRPQVRPRPRRTQDAA
jgi:hypothetical protein